MARTSRTKKELEAENVELRETLESVYDQLADFLEVDDEDDEDEDDEADEDEGE